MEINGENKEESHKIIKKWRKNIRIILKLQQKIIEKKSKISHMYIVYKTVGFIAILT